MIDQQNMLKQAAQYLLASVIILFLASFAFRSVGVMLNITLWYTLLIFLPGFVWIYPLRQGFLATFLLANLVGFAAGFVYLLLDTVRIPLNKSTFFLAPMAVIIIGLLVWRKHYFQIKRLKKE